MAVTVSGKNYSQIEACDDTSGVWDITEEADSNNYKEGSASLSFTMKSSGTNTCTLSSINVDFTTGSAHLRFWFLDSAPGLLSDTNSAIEVGISDGTNTGYYNLNTQRYEGGWKNMVVDTGRTVDSGTKPTSMNAITSIIFRITQSSGGKNFDNVWIDNVCKSDGLIIYGDDAGGYMDFETLYTQDDTSLGHGIIRKIGGVYYLVGSLEIGDSSGSNGCKFQAKSQIVVFEDRPVNSDLYDIDIVDNGTGTTEFILGDKSGTAGIQGCVLRAESASQTAKFDIDAKTDTDVDNFKLYASTFYGADSISLAASATNVEAIACSFEQCSQVDVQSCAISGCFFINTTHADAALLWNENIDISSCTFIANTTGAGIEMPSAAGTPYAYDALLFSGNTYDVYNSSGSTITINKNNQSNPTSSEGSSVTFAGVSVDTTITVLDLSTGATIQNARVLVWVSDDTNFPYQDSVTIVGSSSTATVTHTGHALTTGDNIIISGANEDVYNGVYTITVAGTDTYTYSTSESIGVSPATGTIKATFAFINDTTDINGQVTDSRVVGSNQPVTGWARKQNASPYYQEGNITGTVNSASGLPLTVQLARDE
jgi:hypothetical protein